MAAISLAFILGEEIFHTVVDQPFRTPRNPVNVQRIELRSRVRAFHALSRGAAGSRAISQMLRQSGVDAGRWLVRRLMQECGLTSRQPVKHRYRASEDNSPALPNVLNRQFNPVAPNRVWCGDISFSVPGVQGEHGCSNEPRVCLEC